MNDGDDRSIPIVDPFFSQVHIIPHQIDDTRRVTMKKRNAIIFYIEYDTS